MIRVSVPATSANLGVGYDCMGLALSEFAHVCFEEIPSGLEIIGCDAPYCNEDNLIYQAFLVGLKAMNKTITGLKMIVDTNVPYARGMGSSATCIVAGITGASAMFDEGLSIEEIFHLATEMEGHPDNIAPAIFGGLCVSIMENGIPYLTRFHVDDDFHFVAIIPDYEVSTKQARKVLPTTMSYSDAIYQMGRCVALSKALQDGNSEMLKLASKDRMQEPYRKKLIKEYDDIYALCQQLHVDTMLISGSGSTMLAITKDASIANELKEKVLTKYPYMDVRDLKCVEEGVRFEVI